MVDVYLSYSRADHAAKRLAEALREIGISVWFEPQLMAEAEERTRLRSSSVVVVLWSAHSAKTERVQRQVAAASGQIVSVYIERLERQPRGGMHLAVDLSEWTGSENDREFQRLVTGIRARLKVEGIIVLAPPRTPLPSSPPGKSVGMEDTGAWLRPAFRT